MPATLEVSLGPQLTAEQAEQIYKQGKEAVVFALLEMAKKLAEQQSSPAPSTPSGMVAPYQKPSPKRRGKNKPGRKKGHPGARRKVPESADEDQLGWTCADVVPAAGTFVSLVHTNPKRGFEFGRLACRRNGVANHWAPFAKKLRRLLADAIRLWRRREELPAETYASRRRRLTIRLQELIEKDWNDPQAGRLIKRLRRHQNDLFTFLDKQGVPFDNNHAERSIRPAVIIRKNSYGNRSERGSDAQAVLMSVLRTLKQRGHDPIRTVTEAITTYLQTGQLPPLPRPKTTGAKIESVRSRQR